MAKNVKYNNQKVTQIFDDLANYLEFCKNYGYVYNEADLYSSKSYVYRQYQKFLDGKQVKDMWDADNKSVG